MIWQRTWRALASLVVVALVLGVTPTGYALAASADRIGTLEDVPDQPVAVVFGAGLDIRGEPMPFLRARLDLARQLYTAGKVRVVLVSGDNRRADYNEPDAMRGYLIDSGVPAGKVVADYAGFDTYATCVRAKRIFGVDRAIAVTQSYHLPRAVATCRSVGIEVWGVGDDTVRPDANGWGSDVLREWPANIKMAWDLISGREPVLGQRETSVTDALNP